MRGLLVVNPAATTTTERVRDVLVTALSADLSVETVITKGRGHAAELGQRAVETGVDVVISLGGDGTVNEVVNGLLSGGPRPGLPALAVVPGGSTNVFARALGYSASPVEATGELLSNLREGRTRRVGLGHARWSDQARWFTFCAGMGFDAEVVGRVERKRSGGRPNSAGLYLRSAMARYATGHDRARITLGLTPANQAGRADDGGPSKDDHPEVTVAIVCNTVPWTYLGQRPVRACPEASFDTGLDLLGLRRINVGTLLRTSNQLLYGNRGPRGRGVVLEHDLAAIRLATDASPGAPFQMDGEYLGEHDTVELTSHLAALRVVA